MLGPGPGLGGSDGPRHPPSYDIKKLTLIQIPATERIQLRL